MSSRASGRLANAARLFLLLSAAVLVTLALTQPSIAERVFQSPVSPPPFQPAEPPPPAQPAPSPTPAPVEVAPPPPEVPLEPQTIDEVVPVEPVPVEPMPVEPPLAEPNTEEFSPQAPTEEPVAEPAGPSTELRPVRLDRRDIAADEDRPNFVLNEAQMVDSFIIYGAWVWLCCGVIVFLLIPLAFLFLQIRGRSQILKEEAL